MNFDVIINGGGMVGSASALVLANLGLQVAVIEAKRPADYVDGQPFDLRVSAINLASEALLTEVGAWPAIMNMRSAQFNRLQVWEDGGATLFDREQIGRDHLGHIVENRLIQLGLWQQMQSSDNIQILEGLQLARAEYTNPGYQVELNNGQQYQAHLLIGADGAQSKVRQLLGIGCQGWRYRQDALVIGIETAFEQQDVTWQKMTAAGPRAFLPLAGKNGSLVWYDGADRIAELKQLSKAQLKQQIQLNFPDLAGDFEIVDMASFPLVRRHANRYVDNSALILGDAAHTINPLAGQGVNLGFKDVKALAEVIADAVQAGQMVNELSVLKQFEKKRRADNLLMMSAMDGFYFTFSNEVKPLKFIRNAALGMIDKATPLKKLALQYATGIVG